MCTWLRLGFVSSISKSVAQIQMKNGKNVVWMIINKIEWQNLPEWDQQHYVCKQTNICIQTNKQTNKASNQTNKPNTPANHDDGPGKAN